MHRSNIMLHIQCFSPNVHLRYNRLCLCDYLYLAYCKSVYVYRDRAPSVSVIFMCALQMRVSVRSERRKGTPLRKHTNKDTFRCLITVWSIEIARQGLNELIFVKTSNSTFFTFFLPVRISTHFARMGHIC